MLTKKKFTFTFTKTDLENILRLDQALFQWFQKQDKPLSRGFIRKLIQNGSVYVDQKRVHIASKKPYPGQKIDLYIFPQNTVKNATAEPHIVYEDAWIIIVNKPALMPSVATLDNDRQHLAKWVEHTLQKNTEQSKPYVGIHHRLDKDTSGLILFSKDPQANKAIALLFKERQLQKTYFALSSTAQNSMAPFSVTNHIKNTAPHNKPQRWGSTLSGGLFAQTHFTPLIIKNNIILFKAVPVTGRTHQIRVHLSESGFPILGDTHYRGAGSMHRTMLHAGQLQFAHPVTQKKLCISVPPPQDFLNYVQQFFGVIPNALQQKTT